MPKIDDAGAARPKYLTVPEAAARLRVDPATVRRWIVGGYLAGTKLRRDYRVPAEDVEAMLAGRRHSTPLTDASTTVTAAPVTHA